MAGHLGQLAVQFAQPSVRGISINVHRLCHLALQCLNIGLHRRSRLLVVHTHDVRERELMTFVGSAPEPLGT